MTTVLIVAAAWAGISVTLLALWVAAHYAVAHFCPCDDHR
jgi:hypothetical protein